MSINAYQKTLRTAMSPSQVELTVFRQITGRLLQAKSVTDPIVRAQAINENANLWRIILTDAVNPDNKLADEVKAGLISLAMWVERHSGVVLREGQSIDPLVEVNEQMIEGLRMQVETPPSQPQPTTPDGSSRVAVSL
ncbi:flagellar biosynthesis regulator FlaF [Azospirillum sp. A1-3]|uniref:flagellar biosynthesis regulator FlaF n=1 Tax=Azospirillum sp. A1-3 TaxID=185874 RepID=UPI00207715C5|nr:flagellar biosynthesis regulator FlaF [Azospirillum sp. A1-3]MCM8738745.1 flagellar biosynthesis regulator FlaF [Azospirillum sp. A1-3]